MSWMDVRAVAMKLSHGWLYMAFFGRGSAITRAIILNIRQLGWTCDGVGLPDRESQPCGYSNCKNRSMAVAKRSLEKRHAVFGGGWLSPNVPTTVAVANT